MPLPISSNVFIPNPTTGPESYRAGFGVGQESSPFANIVQGAFQGLGFANDVADSSARREASRAQAEAQRRNQELAEEEFEFKTTTQNDQTNRELNQKDRQLDIQEQRNKDIRATAIERDARLRTNAAIEKRGKIQNAEYESDMAQLVVDGNPDPFISSINNDSKRGAMIERLMKPGEKAKAQAATNALEDAIASGRVSQENLPAAQKALATLQNAPGVESTVERRITNGKMIDGLTGFDPNKEKDIHSIRLAGAGENVGKVIITRIATDGSLFEDPLDVELTETADINAFKKAANAYNQESKRLRDIHNNAIEASKNKSQLSQAPDQTAPARVPAQRQALTELGSGRETVSGPANQPITARGNTWSSSSQPAAQQPAAPTTQPQAVDNSAVRQKIQERLRLGRQQQIEGRRPATPPPLSASEAEERAEIERAINERMQEEANSG